MATEEEVTKAIALGRACEALQKNEALQYVLDDVVTRLFAEWCNCDGENAVQMENIHATMKAVRSIKDSIEGFISNGKIESAQRDFDNGLNNNN